MTTRPSVAKLVTERDPIQSSSLNNLGWVDEPTRKLIPEKMAKFGEELKIKMQTDEHGYLKFTGSVTADPGTLIDISIAGLASCTEAVGVVRWSNGTWHSEIQVWEHRGGNFSKLFYFAGYPNRWVNLTLTVESRPVENSIVVINCNEWPADSSVFVHGGCVSRDAFELQSALPLVGYSARSSLVAAFDSNVPVVEKGLLDKNPSAFQRRMVEAELDRTLPDQLSRGGYDLLLVDFIVERTSIVKIGQSLVTRSPEFIKCGLDSLVNGQFDIDSDEYFERFKRAWVELCRLSGEENVIVNRVFWAEKRNDGSPVRFPRRSKKQNQRLEYLYDLVSQITPKVNWSAYPRDQFVADVDHKWGPAPYHFDSAFYSAQNQLLSLISENRKVLIGNVEARSSSESHNGDEGTIVSDVLLESKVRVDFQSPLSCFSVEILARIGAEATSRNLLVDLELRGESNDLDPDDIPALSGFLKSSRSEIGFFSYIPTPPGRVAWRKEVQLPEGLECVAVNIRKWGKFTTDINIERVTVSEVVPGALSKP